MAADRGTGNVAPNKRTTGVRTWGGSADRPQGRVVAEVAPKQDFQYSGGESSQQNIRRAEANAAPFVSGSQMLEDLNAEADKIVADQLGVTNTGGTGGTDYWSTLLKSIQGGSGGGAPKLSAADVSLQELKYKITRCP